MIADWEVMRRLGGADEIRPAYKFKGPDRPVDEQRQLNLLVVAAGHRSAAGRLRGSYRGSWIIYARTEANYL